MGLRVWDCQRLQLSISELSVVGGWVVGGGGWTRQTHFMVGPSQGPTINPLLWSKALIRNIFIAILFCSDCDIEGPSSSSICHWDYLEFRWLDTKHQPIPCLAFVFHFHFYTFHFHFLTKEMLKKIWTPCTILSKGWWLSKCNFDGSLLWRLVSSPRHHHLHVRFLYFCPHVRFVLAPCKI